jgi:putative acetyltransferase
MYVRRQTAADSTAVRDLLGQSLADRYARLAVEAAHLPALTFVALDGDTIVGHVTAARGTLAATPALALPPPVVHPRHRGRGVGRALMHTVLGAADALGEPAAALVANPPDYYHRFGFQPAAALAIQPPVDGWQLYFLIRPLTAYTPALTGTFAFPAALTTP